MHNHRPTSAERLIRAADLLGWDESLGRVRYDEIARTEHIAAQLDEAEQRTSPASSTQGDTDAE